MIKENRVSKYLLYAIGEIILVVIGILIALKINDWNENRKNIVLEHEMMVNLNEEFKNNLLTIQESIANYDESEHAIRQLMSLFDAQPHEIESNNIDSMLAVAVDVYKYHPTQNVLTEILSSGNLNHITNDSLKFRLVQWSAEFKEIDESWETLDNFNQDMLFPYLNKNFSMKNIDSYSLLQWKKKSKFDINYQKVFNDLEFENHLDNLGWAIVNYRMVLDRLEQLIQKLIYLTDE